MTILNRYHTLIALAVLLGAPIQLTAKDSLYVFQKQDKAFVTDTSNLYLAIPGIHHTMSMNFPFDRWVGIFIDGSRTETEKATINLYETLPSDNPNYHHLEFLSKTHTTKPEFCIANLPETTKVLTYFQEPVFNVDMLSSEYRFKINENEFVLNKKQYITKSGQYSYEGEVVSISLGDNKFVSDSSTHADIFWIGELNSDNTPDFIISYSVEAGREYCLYCSLPGKKLGYKIVSKYRTGGV
jgi:hypothetical protein